MLRLLPVLLIVLFLGCINVNVPAGQEAKSPEIASFTASPTEIDVGGSSTLSWKISGASTAAIDQGIGDVQASGSVTVKPAKSTVYNLTATNPNGTKDSSVTVNVKSIKSGLLLPPGARKISEIAILAPKIEAFMGSPTAILAGKTATLFWVVSGATSITIDNGVGTVQPSGTAVVIPAATTTYTITATGNSGKSTKAVTVTVNTIKQIGKVGGIEVISKIPIQEIPPVIVDFMVIPEAVYADMQVSVFWNVTGASTVTIKLKCMDPYTMTPFDLPVYENLPPNSSMSQDMALYMWKKGLEQQWLTFELSATNQAGTSKKEVMVLVTLR